MLAIIAEALRTVHSLQLLDAEGNLEGSHRMGDRGTDGSKGGEIIMKEEYDLPRSISC